MSTIEINEQQQAYIKQVQATRRKYIWQWRAHAFAHNSLHIIIFGGAVIVPFLIQLKVADIITTIVSALVAVAAAITHFFQFGERRRIYRLASEGLQRELIYFDVQGGAYKNRKPEEAFEYFLDQTQNLMYQNVKDFFTVVGSEPAQQKAQ